MRYIAKVKVLHNNVMYGIGDTLNDLNNDDSKRLLELDAVVTDEMQHSVSTEKEVTSNQTVSSIQSGKSYLSIDAFAQLKATEQKAELQKCNIAPESSADKRVLQYSEWISKQESDLHESI